MAIAFVQKARGQTNGASTTATFGSATTSGNLLVAIAYTNGVQTGLSVTGWTQAVRTNYSGTASSIGIWYKVADGTETTVTSTGSTICRLHIAEYSGTDAVPLDQVNSGTLNATTTVNTGTINTTVADEIIIVGAANTASSTGTRSWSNSFTVLYDDATGPRLLSGELIVAATGAYNSTATLNTTTSNSGAVIASFKIASGGPPVPTPITYMPYRPPFFS